jgi:ABC-2 type transport system permease protein
MARGLGVGAIVTVVSLFFTQLHIEHPLLTVLVVVLTSALFSIGGFINALLANKFDDISIVPTFILTPLTSLGGVFYSISMLPDFWQGVSMLNPIFYMVNVFRYGILGVSDIPAGWALAAVFGFIIVFYTLALKMLERGYGIRS